MSDTGENSVATGKECLALKKGLLGNLIDQPPLTHQVAYIQFI